MYKDFDNQLDNFMLHCVSKNLTRKTMRSYDQSLRLFLRYLEDVWKLEKLSDVTALHLRSYIKYLRDRGKYTVVGNADARISNNPDGRTDRNKPISDTTVANYMRNIKVFFAFLYEEQVITSNPAKKVKNVKAKRKGKRLLTEAELRAVLGTFDVTTFHDYRNWLIARLLLDTGMRIGECLDIKPEQVDLKERSVLAKNTKSGHDRYVFISQQTADELKRWLMYRDRFSDSEYLFPTTRGGRLDITSFEKVLKKAGEAVGVEISPHMLRNSFAKYYLLNGGDFVTLSRILGHSSVEVTQKAYLDFTDNEISRKYQKHSPMNFLRL